MKKPLPAAEKLPMLLEQRKTLRVLGIDDSPFRRGRAESVPVAGVVCAGTRFEGLLWTEVRHDGTEATAKLIDWIRASKFYAQLHAILLDGLALAGFNLVDLVQLAQELKLPCLAVMRRPPDLAGMARALDALGPDERRRRWPLIERAGPIHLHPHMCYQVQGLSPELAGVLLSRVTDTGKVPEALRLAHLITAAVATGQSGKRA